jgi:hypothetical protein
MSGPLVHKKIVDQVFKAYLKHTDNALMKQILTYKKPNLYSCIAVDFKETHAYDIPSKKGSIIDKINNKISIIEYLIKVIKSGLGKKEEEIYIKAVYYEILDLLHYIVDLNSLGQNYSFYWGWKDNYIDFINELFMIFSYRRCRYRTDYVDCFPYKYLQDLVENMIDVNEFCSFMDLEEYINKKRIPPLKELWRLFYIQNRENRFYCYRVLEFIERMIINKGEKNEN